MIKKKINYIKKHKIKFTIAIAILISYYFCLPEQLFNYPTATVITSADNKLLGAAIATDGQWRFPPNDSVPEKFKQCILYFEDEYFYRHPGFNPIAIFKALKSNIRSGKIKRGGSTITQQVIRLSRSEKPRTYFEKIKEIILATRLEIRCSKDAILALYTSYAPYGGNVVGLDAAAWRYFNRDAYSLSWAESATLAVLPNAPGLIHPGKNQKYLLKKRNRLLKKLLHNQVIDSLTYTLAIAENLPKKPYKLPQISPHLLQTIVQTHPNKQVKTTIDMRLQQQANAIAAHHYKTLSQNDIYNMAILILDVRTRKVLAYVGNSPTDKTHQKDVNIIDKPRSTGSILKPFLYTAALDAGMILPTTLIKDTPMQFGNYKPKNFNKGYEGAVPAKRALSRSLNIPAVWMLQQFGLDRFYHYLKVLKLRDIHYNAQHYGLSLILGGAESNLWDLCKNYAAFSSTLNHFEETSSAYYTNEFCNPTFLADKPVDFGEKTQEKIVFDAASIYLTYESLKEVNRPEGNENWEFYDSSRPVAWKTGTSFGLRDAWAIGTTKDHVVGVWVGNADGEGRPGLTGIRTAAPMLFDLFDLLPDSGWFEKPYDEMCEIEICSKSGYTASPLCENKQKQYIQLNGLKTRPCPYHILVHLDKQQRHRVNSSCESLGNIIHKSWFVLPPLMAHYYKTKNPFYKPLPQLREDCSGEKNITMEFSYPKTNNSVFLPRDFDNRNNELILKVVHTKPETTLFWYVDRTYIGSTKDIHDMAIIPRQGKHTITVVDAFGNQTQRNIEISR